MNTLDLARRDAAFIVNSGGFQTELTFEEATGEVVIYGTATNHNLTIDEDGAAVNSKNVHVNVNEADLTAAGVATRDGNNDINLVGKVLRFKDSAGLENKYTVRQQWPTRTFGHIVLILSNYA